MSTNTEEPNPWNRFKLFPDEQEMPEFYVTQRFIAYSPQSANYPHRQSHSYGPINAISSTVLLLSH